MVNLGGLVSESHLVKCIQSRPIVLEGLITDLPRRTLWAVRTNSLLPRHYVETIYSSFMPTGCNVACQCSGLL